MPELEARLHALEEQGLRRQRRIVDGAQGAYLEVDGRRYLAFCSNDYLGLANHPALIEAAQRSTAQYGVGASASALISGHMRAHEQLEVRLADFVRFPRTLYFSSGYMANLGVIPALVERGGTIFSDALNHASLIDGARLARAEIRVYPHADTAQLARMLAECASPTKLIASDAVFSMQGDVAPLSELAALCDRHDAWLLLDDAHGFGVLGEGGRGSLSSLGIVSSRVVYMATLGKAAGVCGAFVAGSTTLIDWLRQRARTYVFTTANPPMLAMALLASVDLIEREEWRRERLRMLITRLRSALGDLPWRLLPSHTPIQPLVVGDNGTAMSLMAKLREQGIWVPAIRPPTVPAGTARLRISLSAAHSAEDVDRLVAALYALPR
jgi:8-amino-7-oxononanoate synthase